MNSLGRNRLNLEIAELQLEMQKLKAQYQTYACSLLSIMIVVDAFLFVLGISMAETFWFIIALCVSITFILLINISLEGWFLDNVNRLKTQIQELKKRYLL